MNYLKLFLKGMVMGVANVIPGVSGGTIAFIIGIYERLINSLKNINFTSFSLLFRGHWKQFARVTDIKFLFVLFAGVFVSILSVAKFMKLAFENYEIYTLSFFFGLILASIIAVSKQISHINFRAILIFLIGMLLAGSIGFFPPTQPNDNFFYLLLCGVVAICSMILPGLSGSYVLLLMGNYLLVLQAIGNFDFNIIVPLILGCVIGLLAFSRLLSYLFSKFKDQTTALLAGFVAGSLIFIWPWKETVFITLEGKEKIIGYHWHLPQINAQFPIIFILMVIGFFSVWIIEKKSN